MAILKDFVDQVSFDEVWALLGHGKENMQQYKEAYQSMERELYNILRESDGKDRVVIYVREPKAVKRLSENWTVNGDEELIQKLAEKFGMENVKTI